MQVKDQIQQLSKECIAKVKQSQQRLQDMTKDVQETQDELIEREVELKRLQRGLNQCMDENERLRAIIVSHIEKDHKADFGKSRRGSQVEVIVDENEAILEEISTVMESTFTQLDVEGQHKDYLLKKLAEALMELEKRYMETMRKLNSSRKVKDFSVQVDIDPGMDGIDDPPPPMPQVPPPRGAHIPLALRGEMAQFPKSRCLASQQSVLKSILEMYHDKIAADAAQDKKGRPHTSAGLFMYMAFSRQYSLQALTDMHVAQFVESVRKYGPQHKRIKLFAGFIGAFEPDKAPAMDMRDLDFLLGFLKKLSDEGHFDTDIITRMPVEYLIPRSVAIVVTRELFQSLLFGKTMALVTKVGGVAQITDTVPTDDAESDADLVTRVRLDDVVAVVYSAWAALAEGWNAKLKELFDLHCTYYEVVRGGAGGLKEEVPRETASEESLQFLRLDGFSTVLAELKVDLTASKLEELFGEACKETKRKRLAVAKRDWQKAVHASSNRLFFYNAKTNNTQWKDPVALVENAEVLEMPFESFRELLSEYELMRRSDTAIHEEEDAGSVITKMARKKWNLPKS